MEFRNNNRKKIIDKPGYIFFILSLSIGFIDDYQY